MPSRNLKFTLDKWHYITGGSPSSTSMKLDLKDQDFSTTSGNYKKARIDNRDGAEVEIKQKEFNQSSKSATLYIDANEGDNIWLRMQLGAAVAGRYAKITSLLVTLLTDD